MTEADAKPTLGERYLRATQSSHLENEARIRGDVDYLIAAGWCKEDVGTMLYRLSCEYDAVRADVRWAEGDTERVLILIKLKSLSSTKEAVGRWACTQATKRRFMESDKVVNGIVGLVLTALLDASCPKCTGRGVNGGYGSPQTICRRCAGTGRIDRGIGETDDQRAFAGYLLAELEKMMAGVEVTMRRFLREGGGV